MKTLPDEMDREERHSIHTGHHIYLPLPLSVSGQIYSNMATSNFIQNIIKHSEYLKLFKIEDAIHLLNRQYAFD